MRAPFHEVVLELLQESLNGGMTPGGFIMICHLLENTKLEKAHEEIGQALEELATKNKWGWIPIYGSALRALQLGIVEAIERLDQPCLICEEIPCACHRSSDYHLG